MTEWKLKRFWQDVTVEGRADGHHVLLDGKPIKSPGKRPLAVPSEGLALAVAEEWRAIVDEIDPRVMPYTKSVNSALDQVAPQRGAVIDMLAAYGETDLLCHRADAPAGLVAVQAEGWDMPLAWVGEHLAAPLTVTSGILPVEQPPASLRALRAAIEAENDFVITGLHDLIALSGSLVLGLAVRRGRLAPLEAWSLSRIDEQWQIAQWGEDEEAALRERNQRAAFLHAAAFIECVDQGDAP